MEWRVAIQGPRRVSGFHPQASAMGRPPPSARDRPSLVAICARTLPAPAAGIVRLGVSTVQSTCFTPFGGLRGRAYWYGKEYDAEMRVAGLMSGTSVDGIDVAVVDIDEARMEVVARGTAPYPEDVRRAILWVSNAITHTAEIGRLHFFLGELFAEAVMETCASAGVGMRRLS